MNLKVYWILLLTDEVTPANWRTDAEQVQASSTSHAARFMASEYGAMEDGEENTYLVAEDAAGTNMVRITVECQVSWEYRVRGSEPVSGFAPPDNTEGK